MAVNAGQPSFVALATVPVHRSVTPAVQPATVRRRF